MNALKSAVGDSGFKVLFETIPAGLRAHVVGYGGFEATVASWREITVEVRKRQARALLLIDELQGTPLTESQWRTLVGAMQGQGLEQTRIAHVKPRGRQSIEFCELFARGIGIDARVFEDEPVAVLWLGYEEQDYRPGNSTRDYGSLTVSHDFNLPGVMRLRISGGGGDPGTILRVWQQALETVRAADTRRLLVVLDMEGPQLSEQELAAVVTRLAGIAPTGLRVALVETRNARHQYDEKASLLAMERGFSVRVFADEGAASLWVRYGAS